MNVTLLQIFFTLFVTCHQESWSISGDDAVCQQDVHELCHISHLLLEDGTVHYKHDRSEERDDKVKRVIFLFLYFIVFISSVFHFNCLYSLLVCTVNEACLSVLMSLSKGNHLTWAIRYLNNVIVILKSKIPDA